MSLKKRIKSILGRKKPTPKDGFRFSTCPPIFTDSEEYLQFFIECRTDSEKYETVVGQISTMFLARWGQIGEENEKDYILSVYKHNPQSLGIIVAELYFANPTVFPLDRNGYPLVNITKEELRSRGKSV